VGWTPTASLELIAVTNSSAQRRAASETRVMTWTAGGLVSSATVARPV
jgi:hypothetical protein